MKISELIWHLEQMMREHGDLDVETANFRGDRVGQQPPRSDHRAILNGREHKPRFASNYYGHEKKEREGEKVCRL